MAEHLNETQYLFFHSYNSQRPHVGEVANHLKYLLTLSIKKGNLWSVIKAKTEISKNETLFLCYTQNRPHHKF